MVPEESKNFRGHWLVHWMKVTGKGKKSSVMRDKGPTCSGTEEWIKVLIGALELNQEALGGARQNLAWKTHPVVAYSLSLQESLPKWDSKSFPLRWVFRFQEAREYMPVCAHDYAPMCNSNLKILLINIQLRTFGKDSKELRKTCK